jgi:hypothetical protein
MDFIIFGRILGQKNEWVIFIKTYSCTNNDKDNDTNNGGKRSWLQA